MIPGLGRSTGEGLGYPLQYSWASLVAQLVKTPPAMQETWVQSLDGEDPLEKGKATHSSILAWRIPTVHGVAKSQTRLSDFHFHCFSFFYSLPFSAAQSFLKTSFLLHSLIIHSCFLLNLNSLFVVKWGNSFRGKAR